MTFFDLLKRFPTEKSIIDHFITVRYKGNICCHHCGSIKVYRKFTEHKNFKCGDCNNSFSVFKDTIFEDSSTDLIKWMFAIHLFLNGKKGISGCQLQRELGVTYKTAWRMLQQIRIAMGNTGMKTLFEGCVEMDETYVGGKPRRTNYAADMPKAKRGRGTKKTPVVGIVSRDTKQVHAQVALPNKDGQKLSGKQLLEIILSNVTEKATIITDEFKGYNILKKTDFIHLRIDHKKAYAIGDIHTNNMESFWAILKRGVYGIYHHISIKYMQRYVNEFCFRQNNRENANIFDLVLAQGIGTNESPQLPFGKIAC